VILTGNAIKYTMQGYIHVMLRSTPELLKIEVDDTGVGIPTEKHKDIFKIYGLVNEKIKKNETGIGFRLCLCKDIVSLMGGQIQV